MNTFRENYKEILLACGLERYATDGLASRFEELTVRLLEANRRMNLTAIKDERGIILKHYADCLLAAQMLPEGARVLDVGCGGGFPTLPFAIVREDLSITALDSTAKKLVFVADTAKAMGLRVKTVAGRAEELGREPVFREKFDAATARAVAALPVLSEWCLPFIRVGGVFLAMKGAAGKEELAQAQNALKVLGGEVSAVEEKALDGALRVNVLVRKVRNTPPGYPRKNAQILKNPL